MASGEKNLSEINMEELPDLSRSRIGIITSEWNKEITESLFNACRQTLIKAGIKKKNILVLQAPGSYELPTAAKMLIESKKMDAIICLGCILQGETRHFEFISHAVANGIMDLNLQYNTPVLFGVLTPDTIEQARDRAGGKHGNKGAEAAIAAIKMIVLRRNIKG